MRLCRFTHTQHLVLQPYSGRPTTCPNRSNAIATGTSPAELDATVIILRDGDRLTPEGYVVEAGELSRVVASAGTNDRSCEDVAKQICDRVMALLGPRPAKEGVLSVEVTLRNGPNIVGFEDRPGEPALTATATPKAKGKAGSGRRSVAKASSAVGNWQHVDPFDPRGNR